MKFQIFCLSVALALVGCSKKEEAPTVEQTQSSGGYLGSITKAQQTMVKKIDTVAIDQAIQRFYTDEGRFPKDINELVSKRYLSTMPYPPNGMKFDYDPNTGAIKVVPQ